MFQGFLDFFSNFSQKNQFDGLIKQKHSFVVEITCRCNAFCRFCSYWKTSDDKNIYDLPLKSVKRYIDGISMLSSSSRLEILGGEPTLHSDLGEIVRYCRKKGVLPSITTNGLKLSDIGYAKSLVDSGIDCITISIEGYKEENDFLRGKGSYEKTMRGLRNLKKISDISITTQSLVTSRNIERLPSFIKYLFDEKLSDNCNLQALYCDFRRDDSDNWWENNPLWPTDREAVSKSINQLVELKRKTQLFQNSESQLMFWKRYFRDPVNHEPIRCNIDQFFTYCDSKGDILICPDMPSVGNIGRTGLAKILSSGNANQARKLIRGCKRLCHSRVSCFFEQLKPETAAQ